jgi:hypothetical protein
MRSTRFGRKILPFYMVHAAASVLLTTHLGVADGNFVTFLPQTWSSLMRLNGPALQYSGCR